MFDIGRVVIKIAGRDARKKGVVVKQLDEGYVLIDGEVRRRKCNVKHLEPLKEIVDINEDAPTDEVQKVLGITVKKGEARSAPERPKKQRVSKKPNAQPKAQKAKKKVPKE